MPKYKNIRVKKRGGGSRLQRVQVLASGKYKFVKNPSRSRKTVRKTSRRKKAYGGRRRVARRRRRRRRRSGGMTIPIAPIVGLVPMIAPAIEPAMKGNIAEAGRQLAWNTIGINPNGEFRAEKFLKNITPLVVGLLVHKFVGGAPLNLNRTLARAKVPFIRI